MNKNPSHKKEQQVAKKSAEALLHLEQLGLIKITNEGYEFSGEIKCPPNK